MVEETKAKEETVQASGSNETESTNKVEPKDVVDAEEAKAPVSSVIGDLNFLSGVRTDLPEIKQGDVLRVFYRVIEGGKERIQVFEGTVIAIKNRGIAKTITVRKTSFGISVERIFPLNSTLVQKIEVKKHQKVRRAKLYYLRNLKGKAARLKELR
jgi:large subunit ribosomal protein L19